MIQTAKATKFSPFPGSLNERHPIAVVDDDSSVRRALQRLLIAMDFNVAGFASAEEFLSVGALNEFECLVVDIQLDGMSGLELWSNLMAIGCGIPTIFISGAVDEATVLAKTGGNAVFLAKPLEAEKLRAAVVRTLAPLQPSS